MTEKQVEVSTKLKRLGFTQGNQVKLYGELFDIVGEPILMADEVVLLDATERKSGQLRRIRLPLPLVKIARAA